jgi:uncharacterized protein YgiM (DUF1202 family)
MTFNTRTRILIGAGFLLALVTSAAHGQNATTLPTSLTIAADVVNVRAGPNNETLILQQLVAGTRVAVTGKSGAWYQVALPDGRTGFILETLVATAATAPPGRPQSAAPPTRVLNWWEARVPAERTALVLAAASAFLLLGLLWAVGRTRQHSRRTDAMRRERDKAERQLEELRALSAAQLAARSGELEELIANQKGELARKRGETDAARAAAEKELDDLRKMIVVTEDIALLQEAGVYRYRHPLTDAVAYERELARIEHEIKEMTKKDGGAVLAATDWTVNGSVREGRAMIRDFSKLMLQAFNAEADNLVRDLRPYKLHAALERLRKVSDTIERLGKRMNIRISKSYLQLRQRELELTADFLQKQDEQREAERAERERLREERKVQQEIERKRARLEKDRQHYSNALQALAAKGDDAAVARMREELADVDRAIESVDYRAANIRAGYVYVISNIGSFGERMVKIGLTRRLNPLDRIRELGDASVPFGFDVHALFFSDDAVRIETEMHQRLADVRVNVVNRRREFFRATPLEVKAHLSELAGEMLQFQEVAKALEYRQCVSLGAPSAGQ